VVVRKGRGGRRLSGRGSCGEFVGGEGGYLFRGVGCTGCCNVGFGGVIGLDWIGLRRGVMGVFCGVALDMFEFFGGVVSLVLG
jgi:hypothetical protein